MDTIVLYCEDENLNVNTAIPCVSTNNYLEHVSEDRYYTRNEKQIKLLDELSVYQLRLLNDTNKGTKKNLLKKLKDKLHATYDHKIVLGDVVYVNHEHRIVEAMNQDSIFFHDGIFSKEAVKTLKELGELDKKGEILNSLLSYKTGDHVVIGNGIYVQVINKIEGEFIHVNSGRYHKHECKPPKYVGRYNLAMNYKLNPTDPDLYQKISKLIEDKNAYDNQLLMEMIYERLMKFYPQQLYSFSRKLMKRLSVQQIKEAFYDQES